MFFRCLTMHLDYLCDLDNTNKVGRRQRSCGCRVQGTDACYVFTSSLGLICVKR